MASSTRTHENIAAAYEAAAQEYLRSLPLEHFMEAVDQERQRAITLASLDLLSARRPDVQVFNELLVQYPVRGRSRPGQVVPDNMVIISDQPVKARLSYSTPVEVVKPFWVLEYVSQGNPRKDYEDNFKKYEQQLKVPYYLIFHPEVLQLTLYRHSGTKYVAVKPNRHGRYALSELDLEVALLDGWVRFWYEGELLPLPEELQRQLDDAQRQADEQRQRADQEKQRAEELQRRLLEAESELARLRQPPPGRRNHRTKPEQ